MEINNEINGIKIDINHESKTDLTEIAKDAYYNDGGKKLLGSFSKAIANMLDLFNNTFGVPIEIYNAWSRPKIEQLKNNIEKRIKNIPDENKIQPQINVILPAIEGLKYNLDQDELRKMFENIIVNSCNSTYADTIHPRFIEIIKQLSYYDALLLKELAKDVKKGYPVANIIRNRDSNITTLFKNCYYSQTIESKYVAYSIDSLVSLGLLSVDYSTHIIDENAYEMIKETKAYKILSIQEHKNISLQKGLLDVTAFGRNFIKTCI